MNLKTADAIRMDWGKFLEITHGTLLTLFLAKIPKSLLPYPENTIREAMTMLIQHFADAGNHKAVETLEMTLAFLNCYVDDKEALESAAKNFKNKKFLEAFTPKLGDKQKKQLAYILEKHR